MAIVGYAHSRIERRSDRPLGAITVDTARDAITDAGLTVADIDGFVSDPRLPSVGGHEVVDGVSVVTSPWLAQTLGADARLAAGHVGYSPITSSVIVAANALASGACDYVLLHRSLHNPAGRYHAATSPDVGGEAQWTVPHGMVGPPVGIALPYNEYILRYGATREALAEVVVEGRRNGARLPWSYWHGKPLTVEHYLSARMISDPISLYDCDIPVDGVAAFVLTTTDRAADLPHRPVVVDGYAKGMPVAHRPQGLLVLDDMMEAGFTLVNRLWEQSQTGITRDDIDVPQLYDGFAPLIYVWLEALGYCGVGEAHEFVRDGRISAETGLPILSGGGAIGNGRMHGVPQMLECYLQLSGRAGERQLDRAEVGLACHGLPLYGGAVLYRAG
ncbi:thiolase family protein [Streptomyces muensis]|uniref:Thiolase family protein n=1 Tax=Streptomyces muensis TaxID=1077944 RepID=A0A9X1PTP7_STRM4|nr:thiolase family protein [Streptomyces muensis]MCF1592340.1 thiolase family protein [Streptomyces muensis]